jgi:SecD/SecF fusion protein
MHAMSGRVLAIVTVVLAVAAGGVAVIVAGSDSNDDRDCSECPEKGVELTYLASPQLGQKLDAATLNATVAALRERSRATKIKIAVSRAADAIVVKTAEPNPVVTRGGELRFYDWEPNIVGRDGRPGSGDPEVRGRIASLYRAVKRASRARPLAEPSDEPSDRGNDSEPARVYAFDRDHQLVGGPDTRKPPPAEKRTGIEMIEVPRGIAVLEAEPPPRAGPKTPRFFYVVEDDVELTSADIRGVEQNLDPFTEEPIVTFGFTARGRKRFERATRRIAARGAAQRRPRGATPAFQRFAIALDDQIVSIATIDHIENPHGIDGSTGAQINGIGSLQDTQELATILRLGPLPVRLVLANRRELSR